ncbi:MAG: type II secretion system F family protein [Mariprofundus sp.]|nr:type II secretion system F family protein [Mariprofundus sp.]
MSLFSYQAIDAKGRRQKGEVEADSERGGRQLLKAQGLVVRSIAPVEQLKKGKGGANDQKTSHLNGADTVLFLQQLATLTSAGMPLVESLASIALGMDRRKARSAVVTIRQSVLEGGSLAEALRDQQMDDVVCNMIAAGEETGQLEAVAARLAELLEHRQELQQELLSATLYPTIILGFGMLVMLFLMAFVVPQVVTVFERSGGNLPLLTKMVIAASNFLRADGGWLIVAVAGLILGYKMAMRQALLRGRRDELLLRLPGIGPLLARIDTARFARTFGMLLNGGVPALAAIHIANQNWSMLPLRRLGESAKDSLREGGLLSDALKVGGMVPHMAVQLLAVGEQSGTLDTMLLRVAEHFEREVSRGLKRMLTVAEPLLVLLMALGVGAMAMAILLPIAEMNELVR